MASQWFFLVDSNSSSFSWSLLSTSALHWVNRVGDEEHGSLQPQGLLQLHQEQP